MRHFWLVSMLILGVAGCAKRVVPGPRGFWRSNRFDRQGNRQGLSALTYYYPNGRVARRGRARVMPEPDGLHFYWFGEWRTYAGTGSLQKVETYTKGKLTATRPVKP